MNPIKTVADMIDSSFDSIKKNTERACLEQHYFLLANEKRVGFSVISNVERLLFGAAETCTSLVGTVAGVAFYVFSLLSSNEAHQTHSLNFAKWSAFHIIHGLLNSMRGVVGILPFHLGTLILSGYDQRNETRRGIFPYDLEIADVDVEVKAEEVSETIFVYNYTNIIPPIKNHQISIFEKQKTDQLDEASRKLFFSILEYTDNTPLYNNTFAGRIENIVITAYTFFAQHALFYSTRDTSSFAAVFYGAEELVGGVIQTALTLSTAITGLLIWGGAKAYEATSSKVSSSHASAALSLSKYAANDFLPLVLLYSSRGALVASPLVPWILTSSMKWRAVALLLAPLSSLILKMVDRHIHGLPPTYSCFFAGEITNFIGQGPRAKRSFKLEGENEGSTYKLTSKHTNHTDFVTSKVAQFYWGGESRRGDLQCPETSTTLLTATEHPSWHFITWLFTARFA